MDCRVGVVGCCFRVRDCRVDERDCCPPIDFIPVHRPQLVGGFAFAAGKTFFF